MKKAMTAAVLLALGMPVNAAPSVFVRRADGTPWWSSPMEARILGQSAGSVTAERLSAYIGGTMIFSPYRVCALEAVQPDTFVGLDRATQEEIEATRPYVAWRIQGVTPDGRRVVGQSVVFEGCHPDDPRGAALLVTDEASGEILRWEPLGEHIGEDGRRYRAWVLFLEPKDGDELFGYSECTECGNRTNVYYDVTRRRIYTEYNGH